MELGGRCAQGWVNFRWPYAQYKLKRIDERGEYVVGGTYEEISFVRSGTVFQIIRVRWGYGSSISDYDSSDNQENQTIWGAVAAFGDE